MRGFDKPRVMAPGAWWLFWLLALILSAARAHANAEGNSQFLQFDPETAKRIGEVERQRSRFTPPPDLPTTSTSEGERAREGNAEIEDVLRASGVPVAGPRDVEREYREVLDAEVRALGREADALDPDEDQEEVPDPDPLARPLRRHVGQQVRVGIDDYHYHSQSAGDLTTDVTYGEYRLNYDDTPAEKTHLRLDSSLFGSTARDSAITSLDVHYRFDRRREAVLGGTAILERWANSLARNDSLLSTGFGAFIFHFPEQLDLSVRYTFTHRLKEQEELDLLTTKNQRTELKLEKRMHGGTMRLEYMDHELKVPSDPTQQREDHVVLGGYTAPILRKVDLDYAYIYRDETVNVGFPQQGAFRQSNNQINLLFRFSHSMSLSVDVDTEFRDYRVPDTTFVPYERTVLQPTVTVIQTPHFSYSFGYGGEFVYHRPPLPPAIHFNEKLNDYTTKRYFAGASYQKKKLALLGSVCYSPTQYVIPGNLQSPYVTKTAALTALYSFDDCTRASAAFSHVDQEFDLIPSFNRSESLQFDLSKKF